MVKTRMAALAVGGAVLLVSLEARAFYQSYSPTTTFNYEYAPTLDAAMSNCEEAGASGCRVVVNLPFTFPYYGRRFTQITISENGWIKLGADSARVSTWSNQRLGPDNTVSTPGGPLIAPMWDDWDTRDSTGAGSNIYHGAVGNHFVVEWWGMKHFGQTASQSGGYTFELKLFPDGAIEFHYAHVTPGHSWDRGASATVGFQDDSDTTGWGVVYNSGSISSSSAYRFTRPGQVAFYARSHDGLLSPSRPRDSVSLRMDFMCASSALGFGWLTLDTTSWYHMNGWNSVAGSHVCGNPSAGAPALDYYGVGIAGTSDGSSVAAFPDRPPTTIVHGSYLFQKRSDLTPAPWLKARFTAPYSTGNQSKLDYYSSGGPIDKPIVILTGFDPLNEDSTAAYLVLMGGLARPLIAEGFEFAIGKHAHGGHSDGMWAFSDEAGIWIDDAYTRNTNNVTQKVQAAGVSQGGVVLRGTLASNYRGAASKVRAWYSIDAPLKGANLGRGSQGVQNLVYCNKGPGAGNSNHPDWVKIDSAAARQMDYLSLTGCSCDDEPENSTCTYSSSWHDTYYNGNSSWPSSSIPRYALVFGDSATRVNQSLVMNLYDFYYHGSCSDDGDWAGGQRDYMAGSRYITSDMVNTEIDHWWCGRSGVHLQWQPAFINVDSALGVTTGGSTPSAQTAGPPAAYTLNASSWTEWAGNNYNEHHTVMTAPLITRMLAWARANGTGSTTVVSPCQQDPASCI